jgi:hypothetical protein
LTPTAENATRRVLTLIATEREMVDYFDLAIGLLTLAIAILIILNVLGLLPR